VEESGEKRGEICGETWRNVEKRGETETVSLVMLYG
jgi:hypothetical protein